MHPNRNVAVTRDAACAASGAFYASLDADSEGHEGKFYVWDVAEIRALLGAEEWRCSCLAMASIGPQFRSEAHHVLIARPLDPLAVELGHTAAQLEQLCATARSKLLSAREQRVRPARDEKMLSSWNALLIRGLATSRAAA